MESMHVLKFVFTCLWLGLVTYAATELEYAQTQQFPLYKARIWLFSQAVNSSMYFNCQLQECLKVSINYSSDGDCYPAVKVEGEVVISVCINERRLSIIGHEFNLHTPGMDINHYQLWMAIEDIKRGKFTEVIFENLMIELAECQNLQFIDYSLIGVYNSHIEGCFHFQNVNNLYFKNCKLVFNENNHFFTQISSLTFYNCSIYKIKHSLVIIPIRRCNNVFFKHCTIFNNYNQELSFIISNGLRSKFINCNFHGTSGNQNDQGNSLLLYFSWMEAITFDGCTVSGKSRFIADSVAKNGIWITNCQFKDIVSDNLLRFIVYSQHSVTIVNSVFKNITSKNILTLIYELENYLTGDLSILPTLNFFNVSFMNNIGTPIFAYNLGINTRNVNFDNNTGIHAGAVFIEIQCSNKSNVYQQNVQQLNLNVNLFNTLIQTNIRKAEHGGDIYIKIECNRISHIEIAIINTSNTMMFIEASTSELKLLSNTSSFQNTHQSIKYLTTSPRYIDTDNSFHGSDVFPGKTIFLSGFISVTDYFHNDASCNANPSLQYDHNEDNCTIQLALNDKIHLKTGKEVMSSVYIIATSVDCLEIKGKVITLEMACDDVTTSVALMLRGCPLGYKPSNHSAQNGLKCEVADEDNFIETDDSKQHIACIDRDYWYGPVNINGSNHPIKVYCGPPYCVQNTEACPLAGYTDTHQKLPWTQDEQCSGLYGGVLCRSCQEHAVFTFGASKCISLNDCKEWQPYLIICLAIVGQIALSLVMICSRAKTTIGVGYLYGPLFFIAVYKLLPLSNSYLQHTSPLEYTFSVYETVLLLDLDIIGKVNWCMFNNINKTLLYSMRFIGPLVTFLVLLVIVLIARSNFCFKFKINRIIQSPIQPMCLLIILSFWSLSRTSIQIIKPIIINGEWRFAIQPEYNYLGNGYIIGLFSISVALLMCFYLPFIFLLFSSQFIRRKINLFRIQPFLDAFQSSYKDKYQWFSGVYPFSWLVLNTELPSYAFVIVITGVSVLQFTLHPHKSKLLNITDNLLLADIIIMSSLSYMRNEDHAVMIIKYPLLIIPLIYILLGGVWIPLRIAVLKCRSMILNRCQASNEPMQDLRMPIDNDAVVDSGDIDLHANIQPQEIVIHSEMEREPLIYDD